MKKFLFLMALLFACLGTSQTVTAATLTLAKVSGDGSIDNSVGSFVSGVTDEGAVWSLALSDLGPSGLADLSLSYDALTQQPVTAFFNVPSIKSLPADDYLLTIIGAANFKVSVTDVLDPVITQTPIPSAVWLFGSAILGLLGLFSRKTLASYAA